MTKRRRPGREHPLTSRASVSIPATSGWYNNPALNVIDKLHGVIGSYALTDRGNKLLREVVDTLNANQNLDSQSLLLLADKVARAKGFGAASISAWHDLCDIQRGLMKMADERMIAAAPDPTGGDK